MTDYAYITRAQLRAALQDRLGDQNGVYWTSTELNLYLDEALQTWGMLTGYWRDTGSFVTTASTAFYDISTLTNTSAVALLSYATTDTTLSSLIQYHLLEPAPGSSWTGSEQFTLDDITNGLQYRRDAFLAETGMRITRATQAHGASIGFFDVPDTTLTVKRVAWTSATASTTYPLHYDDISGQRNYGSSFLTSQDIPLTFSSSSARPLRYIIAPPPNENGTLDILSVLSGATVTAGGISMGIPDDMTWVVKWGALADILGKEGPGQDLTRSYFCERRYRLGVELAKVAPIVINAEINGVALSPESLQSLDTYSMNWQSETDTPVFIASIKNYVALAPCPDGVYSVVLDVVRKAPLPSGDVSNIQVGREYINNIVDYAEHLAAFKCGGEEFRHSFRAADSFFNAALAYNQRLAAQHPALVALIRQSTLDDYSNLPRRNVGNRPLMEEAAMSQQSESVKRMFNNA